MSDAEQPNKVVAAEDHEQVILKAVRSLHYGSVVVTVHNHQVVEVSRQEKIRFNPTLHTKK